MITGVELYAVMEAMVPLYVAMILAYGSVRRWKLFSPDQCSGINRFVAIFGVPLLSFHFISLNNPYEMNFLFIAADSVPKILMLVVLGTWASTTNNGSLEWMITTFSLSTLPNTLVMGIPLLIAMYGQHSASLMVQVVVMQCIIWYTLLLFLYEYRGAKITERYPQTAASIVSFKLESDVVSLDGQDNLETNAEIGDDGKLHVTVRKSNVSSGITPQASNMTGVETYSLSSLRNQTPRGSTFGHSDVFSMIEFPGGRLSNFGPAKMPSVQWSRGPTLGLSNFEESTALGPLNSLKFGSANPVITSMAVKNSSQIKARNEDTKLHTFVVGSNDYRPAGLRTEQSGTPDQSEAEEIQELVSSDHPKTKEFRRIEFNIGGGRDRDEDQGREKNVKLGSSSTVALPLLDGNAGRQMPPASVMTKLILTMVWQKLIRNPNTYLSLIGLIWSVVSFR